MENASADGVPRTHLSFLGRLRSLRFHAARRTLFTWIRPTVLDANRTTLGIHDGDHVAYVLPLRSSADLLVIDHACESASLPRPYLPMEDLEDRAFFFLARPEGRLGRRSLRHQSERMQRLFEHAANGKSVKVVPVSLFWGHQPDKEKSWFKFLFSENWSTTTRLKKFLAMVFYPNHILVQFSPALDLSKFVSEQPERELQIRKLMRLMRVHFNEEKQAILGPDLSHRRTLINSIMESPPVTEAIRKEAATGRIPIDKVERKALGYANEIVSDQSYRVIRFFHILLTWLWNKLYDGIDVHRVDIVKEVAKTHEVVYIPCHRSHIDYLLLSFVLYHNGLTPPHIAAGRNLNLPIIGSLLRRAGAFYMRRSFQGDTLYKSVFDEYLHLMFVRGYSVEYFIEGGRSRTGRMLMPRTGMLSMTLRSFQRDASRPMALLPVYFGYERVLEAPTYMTELAGKQKKDESFFDIFKIFSAFKHAFGKVAVSFGEPVLVSDFLDSDLPGWRSGESDPAAFSDACIALSKELATRINSAAILNPVNLVATALLCTPRQTMEFGRLRNQVRVLRDLARHAPGITVTSQSADEIIENAEQVAGVSRYVDAGVELVTADPDVTILLTYYRNNTGHVFAVPSLIARIVRTFESVDIEQLMSLCRNLHPYLRAEYFLRWDETAVTDYWRQTIEQMDAMNLISIDGPTISIPSPESEDFAALSELAELIQPTLERFFVVCELLESRPGITIKEVETAAGAASRQLSAIYGINSPDFFERSLFSTFVGALRAEKAISVSGECIEIHPKFEQVRIAAATTLDPDVRYSALHVADKLGRSVITPG